MESGSIPDGNIQASSTKTGYEAWKGRLNGQSCWMPANDNTTEHIRVTFATVVKIVAIATQGAPLDGCWVKSFFISYGALNAVVNGAQVKKYFFFIWHNRFSLKTVDC